MLLRQLVRFAFAGAANTLLSGAVFYALLAVLPALAAFSLAYACGLAWVVVAMPRVFDSRAGNARRLALAAWYVVVYLAGVVTTALLRAAFEPSRPLLVLGTLAVTASLGFAGSRRLLAGGALGREGREGPGAPQARVAAAPRVSSRSRRNSS